MSSNENRPSDTHDGEPADPQKRGEFLGYKIVEPSGGSVTFTYWRTESPQRST
jgi:hypothetical protein